MLFLTDVPLIMIGFAVIAGFCGVVSAIFAKSKNSKFSLLAIFFAIAFFASAVFLTLNAVVAYLAILNIALIGLFWLILSALLSIVIGALFVHTLSGGDKDIVPTSLPKLDVAKELGAGKNDSEEDNKDKNNGESEPKK
jgi:RsiW-degrading membrane proteinase PrsW (M82 family)